MTTETLQLILGGRGAVRAISAAASVCLGVMHFRRQMNAQTFLAYTQRYEDIMSELPEGTRLVRFQDDAATWAENRNVRNSIPQVLQFVLRGVPSPQQEVHRRGVVVCLGGRDASNVLQSTRTCDLAR